MRTSLLCLSLFIIVSTLPSRADGPPWDPTSQEVFRDTLGIRISDDQRTSLERTGKVELIDSQLVLLRKFYPMASRSHYPRIATASDNMEIEEEMPYLIWTAPNELRATLVPEILADAKKRDQALTDEGPVYSPAHLVARITVGGQIYLDGQRIELAELLKAFEEKKVSSFSVAPPLRGARSDYQSSDTPAPESTEACARRRDAVLTALRDLIRSNNLKCFQEF